MSKIISLATFAAACFFLISTAKADEVEVKFGPCFTAKTAKELKAAKAELVRYSAPRDPVALATKPDGTVVAKSHPEMRRVMDAVVLPDIKDVGLMTKRSANADGHVVMRLHARAGK